MVYCLHQPLIFEELTGDLCSSLPPSGQEKHTSPSYNELLNVITHAVDKLGLELDSESIQNQSKLIFFTSRAPAQSCRPLPFFQDLHQEVLKSWKQPFLVCITNPAAADFGNVSKLVEHGYIAMAIVEETLTANLAPNSAPTWKSCALLPSICAGLLDEGEGLASEAVG